MDHSEMVVLWDLMGVFTLWCHQTWLAGKIIMAVLFGKSLILYMVHVTMFQPDMFDETAG